MDHHVWRVSLTPSAATPSSSLADACSFDLRKDEIDWEWTGTDTDEAQNNYFWSGDVGSYSGGGTAKASKRDATYHVYGLNWTPDQLQWLVDGKVVRTLTKASTKDGALYMYPQTPSRIQMSVWPAGIEGASQGTLDWAGGMIDWSSSEYKANVSMGAP